MTQGIYFNLHLQVINPFFSRYYVSKIDVIVGLNANRAAPFPQTPTRSATTVGALNRLSPEPFSFSQQSSTSTTKESYFCRKIVLIMTSDIRALN